MPGSTTSHHADGREIHGSWAPQVPAAELREQKNRPTVSQRRPKKHHNSVQQ
jgi:hypothetical protein